MGLHYLCSENKGVGQLCSYRTADLRLCFRICKKAGFLMTLFNFGKANFQALNFYFVIICHNDHIFKLCHEKTCYLHMQKTKAQISCIAQTDRCLHRQYNLSSYYMYEGDSICNEIALITPHTHGLELYTIYGMKEQGFTFRMVHKTLFYHSYLSSYRL